MLHTIVYKILNFSATAFVWFDGPRWRLVDTRARAEPVFDRWPTNVELSWSVCEISRQASNHQIKHAVVLTRWRGWRRSLPQHAAVPRQHQTTSLQTHRERHMKGHGPQSASCFLSGSHCSPPLKASQLCLALRSAGRVWLASWGFLRDLRGTTDGKGKRPRPRRGGPFAYGQPSVFRF